MTRQERMQAARIALLLTSVGQLTLQPLTSLESERRGQHSLSSHH